jgi:hypothetical protein
MGAEADSEDVIACSMEAFDEAQRRRYGELRSRVLAAVGDVVELPNGFSFRLPPDGGILGAVAEWIALERRCCPFFDFVLEVPRNGLPIELRVTGPGPAKEIIRDGLPTRAPDVLLGRLVARR